jgi:chromosome segregation ATPase
VTGRGSEGIRLESVIEDATKETIAQEEEMKKQENKDDLDLNALKNQLKALEATPKPEGKDQMIDFLGKRVKSAEDAIKMCEEIIRRERNNRKEMSQDLKERNATLRKILEQEQRSLKEKVDNHLEATLQMAVRERMQTSEKLEATERQLKTVEKTASELQIQVDSLTGQNSAQQKEILEKTEVIAKLQMELASVKEENKALKEDNIKKVEEAE